MKRKWLGLIVFACLLVAVIPNLQAWSGHNSALKEADREVIEWLNGQEVSHADYQLDGMLPEGLGINEALSQLDNAEGAIWLAGCGLTFPTQETYACTTEVAPWIYNRFLNKEYVETVEEADFVIWRSEPMTPRCDPENIFYKERPEVSVEGLKMRLQITRGDVMVRVYEGSS